MSGVADIVELDEERVKRVPSKQDDFDSAGAMLKAAREARNMSIEDVSAATNIREAHVEAIEAMAIDRLPVAAYTIGFIKAYGTLLDLPVDPLVNRFRKEAGYASSSIAPKVNMPEKRDLAGGRELSLLAVVAILAFIIWVAWQVLREPEPAGPVTITGTPLQERPIDTRAASNGGSNDVPVTAPQPNTDIEPIEGMATTDEAAGEAGESDVPVILTTDIAAAPGAMVSALEADPANETPDEAGADEAAGETALSETPTEEAETAPVELEDGSLEFDVSAVADEAAAEAEEGQVRAEVEDVEEVQQAIVGQAAPDALIDEGAADGDLAEAETEAVVYTDPVRTSRVSPIYPRRCEPLSTGTEAVVVTYDISSRGQPVNVRVTESTNECFNAAAISAVGRWRYDPATRNGSPIPVYTRSTRFRFELPQ